MVSVFINEWKGFLRSRLFIIMNFVFLLSLTVVTWMGVTQNNQQIQAQNDAQKHIRAQWDEMDPTNPHRAAHFGSYAFKPSTVLNSIDEGINAVTGNVLRLEGHKQHDVMFSEASQSLLVSKFGKLKSSLLFQFIIPLFIIFLSFNTYTRERESGRLKLLLIQGSSLRKIILSKVFSVWSIAIFLLLFTTLMQLFFNTNYLDFDTILRLFLLVLSYATYYFIIIVFTVLISMLFKNSTASLSLTILMWLMWTVFLPKIIGNTVEKISPLPTRVEFQAEMDQDRSKGIDGHNPSNERKRELEKTVLAQYNVDNLSELPINFTGILMQADEEYGNQVWDKHFGRLYQQLSLQKKYYQLSGFLNPFASLQNLSMGTAGTDMFHHLDFLKNAELYRRFFIKSLNDEYAYGGSRTGERGWVADREFFQSIKSFDYTLPYFSNFIMKYLMDMMILILWSFLLVFLLNYSSRKVSIL